MNFCVVKVSLTANFYLPTERAINQTLVYGTLRY
jgi:hypothetical protein